MTGKVGQPITKPPIAQNMTRSQNDAIETPASRYQPKPTPSPRFHTIESAPRPLGHCISRVRKMIRVFYYYYSWLQCSKPHSNARHITQLALKRREGYNSPIQIFVLFQALLAVHALSYNRVNRGLHVRSN